SRSSRHSQTPPAQRGDRPLERRALIWMRRLAEQTLIGLDREVERQRIVLGPGETRRVVGQRRSRELIRRKSLGHLPPSTDAIAHVRFRQRPEVPCPAIGRV